MTNTLLIGGTGRCGTNLLKDILSSNNSFKSLPFETRYSIDPDGVVDFLNSAKNNWNPYIINEKINRLEALLKSLQSDSRSLPYANWQLDKHIPNFREISEDLVLSLKQHCFDGSWCGSRVSEQKLSYCSYSYDDLISIFRKFNSDIVSSLLSEAGSHVYVEDNTWNILHADFLQDLFPKARLIHIYRNPRDVIASFLEQDWMPNSIEGATSCYKKMLKEWRHKKRFLDKEFFIEVKFENMVYNPHNFISNLCHTMDLRLNNNSFNYALVNLSRSNVDGWRRRLSYEQIQFLNENISEEEEYLGYA